MTPLLTPPQYRIVEIFESHQGEGYNTGMPAIFLRLGRCSLACAWCDTPYHQYDWWPLSQVLATIQRFTAHTIIVTGGEPTIHPHLDILLDALKAAGYRLCIESNGLHPIPTQIDYIAISPKYCYASRYEPWVLPVADEMRLVVDVSPQPQHQDCQPLSDEELAFAQWAQRMAQRVKASRYFLSPLVNEHGMNIGETLRILGHLNALANAPHWDLSLQTHKLADIR